MVAIFGLDLFNFHFPALRVQNHLHKLLGDYLLSTDFTSLSILYPFLWQMFRRAPLCSNLYYQNVPHYFHQVLSSMFPLYSKCKKTTSPPATTVILWNRNLYGYLPEFFHLDLFKIRVNCYLFSSSS